jgi:hypothetical protein
MRPMAAKRSTALSVIGVIAIIVGGLMALGGLGGIAGTAMQGSTARLYDSPQFEGEPMFERMGEAQAEIEELTGRYLAVTITLNAVHLALAVLLIVGASLALGYREGGRKMFLAASVASIPFDIGHSVFEGWLNLKVQEVMFGAMSEGMQAQQPGPDIFGPMMGVMTILTLVIGGVWLLAKVVLYATTIVYLRKPQIRDLFREAPPAQLGPRGD